MENVPLSKKGANAIWNMVLFGRQPGKSLGKRLEAACSFNSRKVQGPELRISCCMCDLAYNSETKTPFCFRYSSTIKSVLGRIFCYFFLLGGREMFLRLS